MARAGVDGSPNMVAVDIKYHPPGPSAGCPSGGMRDAVRGSLPERVEISHPDYGTLTRTLTSATYEYHRVRHSVSPQFPENPMGDRIVKALQEKDDAILDDIRTNGIHMERLCTTLRELHSEFTR